MRTLSMSGVGSPWTHESYSRFFNARPWPVLPPPQAGRLIRRQRPVDGRKLVVLVFTHGPSVRQLVHEMQEVPIYPIRSLVPMPCCNPTAAWPWLCAACSRGARSRSRQRYERDWAREPGNLVQGTSVAVDRPSMLMVWRNTSLSRGEHLRKRSIEVDKVTFNGRKEYKFVIF